MDEKIKLFANIDIDMRVDAIISKRIPLLSQNDANLLCSKGKVKINGQSKGVKAGQTLQVGDLVEVDFSELVLSARSDVGAKLLPLKIVFEDENLLIVNKPRKLHSVTQKESVEATLADGIVAYCHMCLDASKNPFEAGLIQRLDYYTNGLIIATKNRKCHKMLSLMLLSGQIRKTYLALVDGEFVEKDGTKIMHKTIKTALKSNDKSVAVIDIETIKDDDKDAEPLTIKETEVSFEKQIGSKHTLVRASASAAYRHQIRAHLAFLGFPLTGDVLYGSKETLITLENSGEKEFSELSQKYGLAESGYDGFFLCANTLEFVHPTTKEKIALRL